MTENNNSITPIENTNFTTTQVVGAGVVGLLLGAGAGWYLTKSSCEEELEKAKAEAEMAKAEAEKAEAEAVKAEANLRKITANNDSIEKMLEVFEGLVNAYSSKC